MHTRVSEPSARPARTKARLLVVFFLLVCCGALTAQEESREEQKPEGTHLQVWVEVSEVNVNGPDTLNVKCYGHPLLVSIQDLLVPEGENENQRKQQQIDGLKEIVGNSRRVVIAYQHKKRGPSALPSPLKLQARVLCDGKDLTEQLTKKGARSTRARTTVKVTDVIDGDTIEIEPTAEFHTRRVRLRDIDVPEGGEYGFRVASEFLSKQMAIKQGKALRSVVLAKSGSKNWEYDKHGRLLALVFSDQDDCIAFTLWEQGYCRYNKVREAGDALLAFLDTDSEIDKFWATVMLAELKKKRFKEAIEDLSGEDISQELRNVMDLAIKR